MSRTLTVLSFFLLLASGVSPAARAAPSGVSQMANLQFMVGTWKCTNAIGSTTITESISIVAQNSHWLHGSGSRTVNGQSIGEDFYIGYDADRARWVIVGVDASGVYNVATSATPTLSPSTWIEAYPTSDAKGVFTQNSSSQYTMDTTWRENAHPMSSHEVCTKS
jgi:hypothetical protein